MQVRRNRSRLVIQDFRRAVIDQDDLVIARLDAALIRREKRAQSVFDLRGHLIANDRDRKLRTRLRRVHGPSDVGSFDRVDFAERFPFESSRCDYVSRQPSRQNTFKHYPDDSHSLLNLTNGLLRNSMCPSYVLLMLMLLFFRTGVGARDEQPPKKIACSE